MIHIWVLYIGIVISFLVAIIALSEYLDRFSFIDGEISVKTFICSFILGLILSAWATLHANIELDHKDTKAIVYIKDNIAMIDVGEDKLNLNKRFERNFSAGDEITVRNFPPQIQKLLFTPEFYSISIEEK